MVTRRRDDWCPYSWRGAKDVEVGEPGREIERNLELSIPW